MTGKGAIWKIVAGTPGRESLEVDARDLDEGEKIGPEHHPRRPPAAEDDDGQGDPARASAPWGCPQPGLTPRE
jgi:hypothetical protein